MLEFYKNNQKLVCKNKLTRIGRDIMEKNSVRTCLIGCHYIIMLISLCVCVCNNIK